MVGMQRGKPDRQSTHVKPPFVGVGGKIEDRVDEAQDPWVLIREETKRLREEPVSGFTYLQGALYEEHRWRTVCETLAKMGRTRGNYGRSRGLGSRKRPKSAAKKT